MCPNGDPTAVEAPRLLYEDADLLAVDKPAGITVIPAPGAPPSACLQHHLMAARGERLWVVHRLDRDTSGIVIFARSADAHRRLSMAFEAREVAKTYLAFVNGTLDPPAGRIDIPLHEARRGKARPAREGEPGAKAAATTYAVQQEWMQGTWRVALVELRPETGRHHQLRVHLRARGAPILFDRDYGRGATPEALVEGPCRRLALHALRLDVPAADGVLTLEAPLARDLVALRGWLERGAASDHERVWWVSPR